MVVVVGRGGAGHPRRTAYHGRIPRQCLGRQKNGVGRGGASRPQNAVFAHSAEVAVRPRDADVDERDVSKNVYIVGAIGAAGCLMLSLMMQHLLKVQTERSHSPVAEELKEACADHLVGAIEVQTRTVDGAQTMIVRMTVRDGDKADALARTASDLIWRRAYKWSDSPDRLRVEVAHTAGDKAPAVAETGPPGLDRLRSFRRSEAKPPAPRSAQPPK